MSDVNLAFAKVISTDQDQIDIARAALLYARDAYPNLDVNSYLARLDDMAEELSLRLNHQHPITAINGFLFDELAFRGNEDHYFDPRNSFLNQVLDRRIGIPITLSVIYLELARRLHLPMKGIGLPGHFVVRYDGDQDVLYLDPFNRGKTLTEQDCRRQVTAISGGRLAFDPSFLTPLNSRQILSRMLRNLKAIYTAQGDFKSAVGTVEKLILLNPKMIEEIRDLGVLHYYAGHKLKAVGCLEKYLELAPDAEDIEIVRHNLRVIIEKVARWN
jgi:regulator of sirC expression with transglutaminase-like and TPR domain